MCGLSDLVSSCLSSSKSSRQQTQSKNNGDTTIASLKVTHSTPLCNTKNDCTSAPFLKASQFTNVPPTIRFYTKGTKVVVFRFHFLFIELSSGH